MEPQSGIKTWQWVVTVLVIIALIVIGVMVFGGKGTSTTTTTPVDNSTSTVTPRAVNSITMTDQFPGNVAYLSAVQVGQPSWIVIHADNGGLLGKIIGHAHVDAGINANVKVTLTQPTVDGATYYAVIYSDDGSGTFSATKDQPLKDANANVIMHIFHASASVGAGLKG